MFPHQVRIWKSQNKDGFTDNDRGYAFSHKMCVCVLYKVYMVYIYIYMYVYMHICIYTAYD